MKSTLHRSVVAGLVMISGGVALAQDGKPPAPKPAPAPAPTIAEKPKPSQPAWTDAELGKIGDMLTGTWKTEKPVQAVDGSSSIDIVMAVIPVAIDGLPNALYVESARADAMQLPYRQSILQLYHSKGKIRMRTLDPHSIAAQNGIGAWVGMWAAKELLPNLTRYVSASDFIGTMDMVLTPGEGECKGRTPYAYPTASGGAIEMTSEFSVTRDTFKTGDRGFDAEGKEVWGAPPGGYTFKRYNAPVVVRHMSDGLTAIDFASPESDLPIQKDDRVTVQYTGWTESGVKFDSSRTKPTPFTHTQGSLIQGWNIGLIGATKGTIRRLYIPAGLGYGERGNPRANIAPNMDLVFEIEVLHVERPKVQGEDEHEDGAAPQGQPGQSQPSQSQPGQVHPVQPPQPK